MQHEIPDYPEQDESGGDNLPTYDDLAAQKGPNSRFGRWKSWVEKRAAERFADLTPEERARRRARGWGEGINHAEEVAARAQENNTLRPEPRSLLQPPTSIYSQGTNSNWSAHSLQTQNSQPPSYDPPHPPTPTPIAPVGEPLLPSHLKVHQFGSRFLPHATYPINALLPLMCDRLLLIGHGNGLSVLDMFPSGNPETSSPADAEVRHIWEGEGVYQLELLEFHDTGDLTPHGVVLALVGSEVDSPTNLKEKDVIRSIRMYNLSSLTSLARWATSQKNAKPLDLRRPPNWVPQQTAKKHKHSPSGINIIKNIINDGQNDSGSHTSLYPSPLKRTSVSPTLQRQDSSKSSTSTESSWDVVDELPLRWATDFVPLASAGSRLLHLNVLFFELWKGESGDARGPSSLAIATKTSILVYETPKGERAFRFSKEFYTPLQPRAMSFVHQKNSETIILRSPSESSYRSYKSVSPDSESSGRRFSSLRQSLDISREWSRQMSPSTDYGAQLSLFVVFDKKAGLIRLADSAVGEVELSDESLRDSALSPPGHSPRRSFIREPKGVWLPPSYEELPLPIYSNDVNMLPVYALTRGKQTHIIPAPIPTPLSTCQPLYAVTWQRAPSQVQHRVCSPLDDPPFLQLIGFSDYGIEVQETPLSVFSKGKGKGRVQEPVQAETDLGGDVAFLYRGGRWHEPRRFLSRSDSITTYSSVSTMRQGGALRKSVEDGFYASCRKGLEDWRVFWLGGEERDDYGSSDI